jgi:hypothetical protein
MEYTDLTSKRLLDKVTLSWKHPEDLTTISAAVFDKGN